METLPEAASASTETPDERFGGIARLYGETALSRLRASTVLVIGLGGVGSWTVEALARSGLGTLTLVDLDDVCVTNTNRQLHALEGTIGRNKAAVLAERVLAIHPSCHVRPEPVFYSPAQAKRLLEDQSPDLVVDAIDAVSPKCHLLAQCHERRIPIVTSGGAGGKRDPAAIQTGDLAHSAGDALLIHVRRHLRREYGFPGPPLPPGGWSIPCAYSPEQPVYPTSEGSTCDHPEPGTRARLTCDAGYGTSAMVTGTFGLMLAALAVETLLAGAHPSSAR